MHREGLERRPGRNQEPEGGFPVSPLATECRPAKIPTDRLALICMLVDALHLVQHLEKMKSHLKVKSLEGDFFAVWPPA